MIKMKHGKLCPGVKTLIMKASFVLKLLLVWPQCTSEVSAGSGVRHVDVFHTVSEKMGNQTTM